MVKSNVLNIGKIVRANSGKYRVSPGAVHELVGRLDLWFELNTKELCRVTRSHNRHTVSEDDVVEFFSLKKNEILS